MLDREDAVGHAHHLAAVGDHDDGLAQLADEPVEEIQDDRRRVGVEGAGGLVGEDQRRVVDQRSRDGDPLLLASGEPVGEAPRAVGEPDALEQGARPRAAGRVVTAGELERQQQVLLHGEEGDQVEELEDEPDAPPPEERAVALAERRDVGAVHHHRARGRQVDAADQVEERGLSRPAAADQHRDLALPDRGVHVAEDDALAVAFAVELGQAPELDGGRPHRPAQETTGHPTARSGTAARQRS